MYENTQMDQESDESDDGDDSTVIKIEPVIIIENEPMMYSSNEDLAKENTSQSNEQAVDDDKKPKIENSSDNKPKDYQRKRRQTKKNVDKRFTCDICNSSFAHSSNLNAHKKVVHKKIRPYGCEICDKCFPNAFALKRHAISHTSMIFVSLSLKQTAQISFNKTSFFFRWIDI